MRVAIAFFGLTGSVDAKHGAGTKLNPSVAAQYNIPNLVVPNRADVFIHTWSGDQLELLQQLYRPVRAEYEDLPVRAWRRNLAFKASFVWWLRLVILGLRNPSRGLRGELVSARNSYFRYRSHSQVLRQVQEYVETSGTSYDVIFLSRLDVAHLRPFRLDPLEDDQILVSHWNNVVKTGTSIVVDRENEKQGKAFLDLWFCIPGSRLDDVRSVNEFFFKYHHNPHRVMYQHSRSVGLTPVFSRYRWTDYEMVRRYFYGSEI